MLSLSSLAESDSDFICHSCTVSTKIMFVLFCTGNRVSSVWDPACANKTQERNSKARLEPQLLKSVQVIASLLLRKLRYRQ
jgi:hypothetical protein